MTARLLDGVPIAEEILAGVRRDAAALTAAGRPPRLAALLIGHAASSEVYIRNQKKACEESGIGFELRALEATASEPEVLAAVRALNVEPGVTGIILHQPFPPHIDERRVREALNPARDVESMTPHNFGRLVMGQFEIAPSTASAALEIARREHPDMTGLEVTIVGHSEIVGKPLALLLLQTPRSSPTVTVCHISTRDLAFHTRRADLVFVAAGVPGLLQAGMVRPGATVIDIGINRVKGPDGKSRIVGDAAPDVVSVAGALTPVPGGVGPVTVAVLLRNTVRLAQGPARA
ncbi:MAG: bifunctional 5,10-methylenetetrahydrofolate dehydrogenase/5,10-methenyltetrahydrofolate cyclohydrolase [Candidatus Brocadiae bacterium]|nr:bifunctional 5,10-methylenetetrahydrofolate dehydrogenase/5,10-methenyltetrahydrofolate cyclohydrolase [Candidatus Brocadiia bacterium]